MHFDTKSYLKSNHYHTAKHALNMFVQPGLITLRQVYYFCPFSYRFQLLHHIMVHI